jgi:hypothetical protein
MLTNLSSQSARHNEDALVQAQPQHEKRALRPSTMERYSFAAATTTANANEKACNAALKSIPDEKVRDSCGNMR